MWMADWEECSKKAVCSKWRIIVPVVWNDWRRLDTTTDYAWSRIEFGNLRLCSRSDVCLLPRSSREERISHILGLWSTQKWLWVLYIWFLFDFMSVTSRNRRNIIFCSIDFEFILRWTCVTINPIRTGGCCLLPPWGTWINPPTTFLSHGSSTASFCRDTPECTKPLWGYLHWVRKVTTSKAVLFNDALGSWNLHRVDCKDAKSVIELLYKNAERKLPLPNLR